MPIPPNDGYSITSSSYTVVVRADSTVTGVQYNIQNSDTNNWDIYTGQANGNGNDTNGNPIFVSATQVTPNQSLNLQYPNDPQEFRFVYTNVPASGTATISVRLRDYATSIYTNEFTTLTRTVNTLAPMQVVDIVSPATDGTVLNYSSNLTYLVRACFSSSLAPATNNFNVLINGVLQPQANYILAPLGRLIPCSDMQGLLYNWNNPPIGTNVIQVIYTNAIPPISDTRSVIVAPPLVISGLGGNNQLVLWNSAPGVNYEVLATTNLTQPFQPISGIIPSQGTTTSFYDANPAPQKFYEIEMVQ